MTRVTAAMDRAARDRKVRIRDGVQDHVMLVLEAIQAKDWQTLGYRTPLTWYKDVAGWEKSVSPEILQSLARELHKQGYSLRGIGKELDIGKSTVQRQLSQGGTPDDDVPERVTGQDGKSYPAVRPPREQAPEPPVLDPQYSEEDRPANLPAVVVAPDPIRQRLLCERARALLGVLEMPGPDDPGTAALLEDVRDAICKRLD